MKRGTSQKQLERIRQSWGLCRLTLSGNHFLRIVPDGAHNEYSSEVRCIHCEKTMRLPHGIATRAVIAAGWIDRTNGTGSGRA